MDSVRVVRSAGFVIHPVKSVFEPRQIIQYLGFVLNSTNMTVKVAPERVTKLCRTAALILESDLVTIRRLAELVGMMVSSFPGVAYGPLLYRLLDNEKSAALARQHGNFDAKMVLSSLARSDIEWWINHIEKAENPIIRDKPSLTLQSDASTKGWGGVCREAETGGNWSSEERESHINVLELKAGFFTLRSFCKESKDCHIRLEMDNTTAVAYLNSMGGKKTPCNTVAREMWLWSIQRNLWLSATHLPGVANVQADKQSRLIHERILSGS